MMTAYENDKRATGLLMKTITVAALINHNADVDLHT